MNPSEIPQLLAQIALADPRVRRDDPIERRAQIHMWAGILANVPYDYAITAAHQHYSRSTWPILPADIATRWQATVRDRMNRHTGTFEPVAHPEVDPDDPYGNTFVKALRAERHAVATGPQPPSDLRAITSGRAAAEVEQRLARLGTYMPSSVRDALADAAPDRPRPTDPERAALLVPCPFETCRAPARHRCRLGATGQERRTPHPSRIAAAQQPAA
jgi:hypothetical protein